jgi:hypothetical protein
VDIKTPFLRYLYDEAQKSKGLFSRVFGKADKMYAQHEASLDEFNSMRDTARRQVEPSVTARDVLLRYFYQISCAESRFPVGDTAPIKLKFAWSNSFNARSRPVAQYSLVYEKACVFFNAIAVETQIGCATERLTKVGIKEAAKHFCTAAGMLEYLKEAVCCNLDDTDRGADLFDEVLDFLAQFMVAQAQMCTYDMGAKKPFPPKILAQIAMGTRDAYLSAVATFDGLRPALQKSLGAKCAAMRNTGAVVALYFEALAHYQQGCADLAIAKDTLEGFGAVIKRLNLAKSKCACAVATANAKATRVNNPSLLRAFHDLEQDINGQLVPTERTNQSVSFESVDAAVLESLEGKILAKSVPYVMDSTVIDPFRSIVPGIVHEVVAEFTTEVDAMFLEMTSNDEDASKMAQVQLHSLGLPGSIDLFIVII